MLIRARAAAAQAAAARESAGPLRDALVSSGLSRAAQLAIGDEPLVFGRLDGGDGRRLYVGRTAVYDEDHEPLVTDWRAPAAEPFYRATAGDPMGIVRRRHIVCRGSRVLRLDDELLDEPPPDAGLVLVGEGALLDAIGRGRTGRMRDIVATIQAEQDAVIRAPLDGALVVQGGPGTGKTAVALHRAAYLLYTHRARLERAGVLVVGPNAIFLRYIDQVLPSLGETATLATGPGLSATRAMAGDPPAIASLKGDERMADVVARAVASLPSPLDDEVVISYEGSGVSISPAASRRMVELARRRFRGRHNARHRDFVDFALTYLWRRWADRRADWVEILGADARRHFESTIRSDRRFRQAVNEMWPAMSPGELVQRLLSAPNLLRAAADGILSDEEQSILLRAPDAPLTEADAVLADEALVHLGPLRRRPRRRAGVDEEERWTVERMLDDLEQTEPVIRAERAFFAQRYMDARRDLDEDERSRPPRRERFGYVIVDEAQGMDAMQWRMIARRCPSRRTTILGDLGQAALSTPPSWEEMLAPLGASEVTVAELTVNYRTPVEIMDVAARVLALAAPGAASPRSVREGHRPPVVRVVAAQRVIRSAVAAARAEQAELSDGKVAVVAPTQGIEAIAAELGLDLTRLDAAGLLDAPVTVLDVDDVRGLEFDAVVVVEPQEIVDTAPGGFRALYVALTRPTQSLVVIGSPMAEPLRSALAPPSSRRGSP